MRTKPIAANFQSNNTRGTLILAQRVSTLQKGRHQRRTDFFFLGRTCTFDFDFSETHGSKVKSGCVEPHLDNNNRHGNVLVHRLF